MSISFSCEKCGKSFETDAGNAGKKGKCKQCGHAFVIPGPGPGSSRPGRTSGASATGTPRPRSQATPKPAPEKPRRPSDPDEVDDPYGLDEAGPLPPRQAPASRAGEEGEVRRPAPLLSKTGKKKPRTAVDPGIFGGLPLAYYLFAFALAGVSFAVGNQGPSPVASVLLGLSSLVALVTLIYGSLGMILIPNREGTIHGLLAFFFWPYQIFYLATRWSSTHGAFLSQLAGIAIMIVGVYLPAQSIRRGPVSARGGGQTPPGAQATGDDGQITVVVTGLTDADSGAYFHEKLANIENTGLGATYGHGKGVFQIRPNMSPEELARRIDFAKVTNVSGRTIQVVAGPAPARPARPSGSDPISQTLYDLQGPGMAAKQTALGKLRNIPLDPDRRDEVAGAIETVLQQSKNGFVRADALRALAIWGRKESTPVLLEVLEDTNSFNAHETLITLAALKDPAAAKPVAALLVGTEHRSKAMDVLKAIGSGAEPAVIKYVNHKDRQVRLAAIEVLEKIGTAQCVPTLQELLKNVDPQSDDGRAASRLLERIGPG